MNLNQQNQLVSRSLESVYTVCTDKKREALTFRQLTIITSQCCCHFFEMFQSVYVCFESDSKSTCADTIVYFDNIESWL